MWIILLLRASLEFSPGVLNLGRCLVRRWNGPGRGKCDFLSGKISPAKRTTGGWVCHCVLTAQQGAAAAGLGSIISAAVKRVAGENQQFARLLLEQCDDSAVEEQAKN